MRLEGGGRGRGPAARWCSALLVLACLCAGHALAQDSFIRDFKPTKDYRLMVEGKPAEAQIYAQGELPAVLVYAPSLSAPVMLQLRAGQAAAVNTGKVVKYKDGSRDLMPGALVPPAVPFTITRQGAAFTYEGKKVILVHAPADAAPSPAAR
jgi:hypothetical protein